MVVVVALVVSAGAAIVFIEQLPARYLASLSGMTLTVSSHTSASPTPTPVRTPRADVAGLSLSVVAIQTFSGPTLVRYGSGVVVASDGLIVTTSIVAPYGSGSYVYQVTSADGSLLRAKSVWRNGSGLVLLKVTATDMAPIFFDDSGLRSGESVDIVGAYMRLSSYVPVLLTGQIPYADDPSDVPLSMDRSFMALLPSALVADEAGHAIGLVQPGSGHARVITAESVNNFVERYLSTTHR